MAAGDIVDLRSDTVTRPSAEMRQVIAEAEVGYNVLGDDWARQLGRRGRGISTRWNGR